jgi:serine/threonine protein kinase
LEHAHQRGLIHRDIKPGNILVTASGLVKVSDLGLAGHFTDIESRQGKIVGTADYLAPEQIRSPLDVSKVADIYALGCTLYYAITGKVPFPGGNAKSKARRHLEETPWHPRRFNPEVSDEFVDLIGDMMEKDPRERIQSAAEVAERLAPWATDDYVLPDVSGARERWSTTEQALAGDEDTDPGGVQLSTDGGGDSAGSESGALRTGSSNAALSLDDKGVPPMIGLGSNVPPPPFSPTSAYHSAAHRSDEMQFSMTWVVIIGLACIAVGTLFGLILALTII